MKVYVITPVGPATPMAHLMECIESVADQVTDAEVRHLLVYDCPLSRAELPVPERTPENLEWMGLPANCNDIGSTPRTVGAAFAWGAGADAICFLDADCAYLENHVDKLVKYAAKTGKQIVCSGRFLSDYTGAHKEICPEINQHADPRFHDTNTYLITREAIGMGYVFGTLTGRAQHLVGDRILTERALPFLGCHYQPTIVYRTTHRCHYETFGWPVPPDIELKDIAAEQQALAKPN